MQSTKKIDTTRYSNQTKPIRYLFLAFDKFIPFRVDVSILFGKELVNKNHHIDFVLQSEQNSKKSYVAKWSGSTVFVGAMDNGLSLLSRLRKNIFGFLNDIKALFLLSNNNYNNIIIISLHSVSSMVCL